MATISSVHGRRIIDSRGNPTVEVEVQLESGAFGRAAVPSGASTGSREALELRDKDSWFAGKDVKQALKHVNGELKSEIIGKEWTLQSLDNAMIKLDGTENKSRLGANALLGISMAFAVAHAQELKQPLYEYIHDIHPYKQSKMQLPRPMLNILNGGAHADWTTDIQEYMILPMKEEAYTERLRKSVEVFHALGKLLKSKGYSTHVGNEGGYAPALTSNAEAFEVILTAIEQAGYTAGPDGDFLLAIDAAASEFYEDGMYQLRRDNATLDSASMVDWVVNLANQYPIYSLEDPLAESDWDAWASLTAQLGEQHQIVGDDLLVTNTRYIERATEEKNCNSVLIKLNQIGTVSETLAAIAMTQEAGWTAVPSHRSGETEDVFLAHLSVGTGAGQIKTGAPSRTDRTAKYNELLRIEEQLQGGAQ